MDNEKYYQIYNEILEYFNQYGLHYLNIENKKKQSKFINFIKKIDSFNK